MVEYITLNGSIRKDLGSSNANRLRKEGLVPAVIYGLKDSENVFISLLKKDFYKEFLKGSIQIRPIEIKTENKSYKVLTYQIDIDPVTDMPRHVDFMSIDGKNEVKVYIPVNFLGREKSPGIKKGGFLNILKRKIQCFCNPESIPNKIDIDVSKMHIGSKIKINDAKLPENIKATDKSNFDICSITGRGKSIEEEEAAAAAATAATTAAATSGATATTTEAGAAATEQKGAEKTEANKK